MSIFFQNDQLLNIYQEILTFFLSDEQLQRKSTFYVWFVNKKNLGGSKNFFIPPQKLLVCGGVVKTESGKFHEILASVGGGLKTFLYPPKIVKLKVPNSMKY